MKKNILAENMRRFATKNLQEQQVPNDKIIKIMGSEPYYKVIYRDGNKNVEIDFEDYEVMDKHDYGAAMAVYGTDNMGNGWVVSADAVSMGGGDFDWDFDWDSLEKQHGGSKQTGSTGSGRKKPYQVYVENTNGDELMPEIIISETSMVAVYKIVRRRMLKEYGNTPAVLNDADLVDWVTGDNSKIDDAYIEENLLIGPPDSGRDGETEGILGEQVAMYIREM